MIRELAKRLKDKCEQQRADRERRAFIRMCIAARFQDDTARASWYPASIWVEARQIWEAKPDDC